MFCTNCGAEMPEGALFCTNCGKRVGAPGAGGDVAPEPAPAPAQQPAPAPAAADSQVQATQVWPQAPVRPAAPGPASAPGPAVPPHAVSPMPAAPAQAQRGAGPSRQGSAGRGVTVLAVVLVVLAIGAVTVCAGVMTDWFGLAAPQEVRETVPADDGQDDAQGGTDAPSQDGGGAPAEEGAGEPAVRAAVSDYSWEELSQVSALISSAGSDDAAIEVAKRYHLCRDDGTLDGTQTKSLTLSDGTSVTMVVAGFNHDSRADGSGVAGITFVSRGIVGSHQMNGTDTTSGGWRDSALRSWMNGELASRLPADVADVVVPVNKLTNTVGETTDASAVQATSDRLWTLSYSEICGPMSTDDPGHDAVYNAEGAQYQLYSDLGVRHDTANSILQIGGVERWWERTPDPMDGRYFMCVGEEGTPWYAHVPTNEFGVVMCFCV